MTDFPLRLPLMKKTSIYLLAAACFAIVLAACGTTGGTKQAAPGATPAARTAAKAGAALEDRAVERWQHMIAGQPELAYDFMSPGARSTKSREAWAKEMSERPIKWKKVNYLDKACDSDDACEIRVQIEYQAPLQGTAGGVASASGILTERWIRIDGIWYFLPESLVSGGLH
jgi:hypothetical protein